MFLKTSSISATFTGCMNNAIRWGFGVTAAPSCPSGLQHVHLREGLRRAAVLHPEEAVLAERPPLRRPPLPCNRRLSLLPGQQDRARGLEEASGE